MIKVFFFELFCSALAILEPQIYIIVQRVGAEKISLLSERLVSKKMKLDRIECWSSITSNQTEPFVNNNKPGPAQIGAISKAQNYQKDFQVSLYGTRKSKNQKKGPSGSLGPASASPSRATRGHFRSVNIFVEVEEGPFGEKANFRKSLKMPKN